MCKKHHRIEYIVCNNDTTWSTYKLTAWFLALEKGIYLFITPNPEFYGKQQSVQSRFNITLSLNKYKFNEY